MFGMSGTEMIIILVFALLLFGPQKLPEIAKMAGKAMREFQKATNDIKSTVEHEFNKIAELEPEPKKPEPAANRVVELKPAPGAVAVTGAPPPVAPAADVGPRPADEEKAPS